MKDYPILGPAKQKKTVEWRQLFTPEQLKGAADPYRILNVNVKKPDSNFYARRFRSVYVTAAEPGTRGKGKIYSVEISSIPQDTSDSWNAWCFSCHCRSQGSNGLCIHEAAAMLALEKEFGGAFIVEESEWQYRRRMEQEKLYLKILEARDEMIEENHDYFPVSRVLTMKQEGLKLYDLAAAARNMVTNKWAVRKAKQITSSRIHVREVEERNGSKYLCAELSSRDPDTAQSVSCSCTLEGNRITSSACSCEFHEMDSLPDSALCPHQLAILKALRDFIQMQIPSDLTDDAARKFFSQLHSARAREEIGRAHV